MIASSCSVTTDDLAQYPHVPEYYLVAKGLSDEQVESVRSALAIAPVAYAIITDPADSVYALNFAEVVLQSASEEAARATASAIYNSAESNQWARSIIVRTQYELLVGVYADREGNIPCS